MKSGKIKIRPLTKIEKGILCLVQKDADYISNLDKHIYSSIIIDKVNTDTVNFKDSEYPKENLYELYVIDNEDQNTHTLHKDSYAAYWIYFASMSYMNKCSRCKEDFIGHKRQTVCRSCLETYYRIEGKFAIADTAENMRAGIFNRSTYTEEDVQGLIDYVKNEDPDPSQFIIHLITSGFEFKKKGNQYF